MSLDVLISPDVLETDEDLRSFPISERKCYMEGERTLRFFKKYSVRNCEMECFSTFTYEKCRCVPFYTIRNSTMEICSFSSYDCYRNAKLKVKLGQNFDEEKVRNCKCLTTCNTINYNLEYIYNDIKADGNNTEELNQITISFRFKNDEFIPKRRYRNMDFLEFLAETAGLLGLYCGVSILTFVELIYFFMIRPTSNFIRRIRKQ